MGKMFNDARKKHQQQFQASGKTINFKVRLLGQIGQVLIEARQIGNDPFAAIEAVISRDSFTQSITESGLKITPLETIVPESAQTLIDQTAVNC